jgi:hypothetical protein
VDERLKQTVFAVQTAIAELLDVAAELEPRNDSAEETFSDEAEQTVLRFIAAIIVADGRLSEGETEFISILINSSEKSGGAVRYLNEYASKWRESYPAAPKFFKAAIEQNTSAFRIIQLIQTVGANVCVCDNCYGKNERKVVEKYISFLNDYRETHCPTR